MKRRYFFVLPDKDRPVGGINVALQIIKFLRDADYEAFPLYGRADHTYRFFPSDSPVYFWPELDRLPRRFMGRKAKLKDSLSQVMRKSGKSVNRPLELGAGDVLVLPEFAYPEYCEMFPDTPRVLLVQGLFLLYSAYLRDRQREIPWISQFENCISTSQSGQAALEHLTGETCRSVPIYVTRPGLDFAQVKKRQITYMPRRRQAELDVILTILKPRLEPMGWRFVPIHNVSHEDAIKLISESLIFLSFSQQEGFGLPPAEAMATGSLVIGYTGVGGEEFFSDEFSFAIPDGDVVGFSKQVEAVAMEYDRDPERIDHMRRKASDHIHKHYGMEQMREAVLEIWKDLDEAPFQDMT